jgi:hypothetical protein
VTSPDLIGAKPVSSVGLHGADIELTVAMTVLVADQRIRAARPHLSDLGLNRLGWFLTYLNLAVLVIDVTLFGVFGLTIKWSTAALGGIPLVSLFCVWLNFYFVPGRRSESVVAEFVLVVGLMVLFTNVGSIMQYGAIAAGLPYADWWLADLDAAMGIHVASLAAWTEAHPVFNLAFKVSYASLIVQFFFAILVLAAYRDRARVWEFAFHFHVCLVISLAALVIFPAICPPAYFHFQPTIDMTRVIRQIRELHDGSMKVVRFDELEGLVSFPSFHAAGGFIVTWVFRDRRRFCVPLAALNVVLFASTFMTGVHYLVDVLASIPLFAFSVFAYRRWGSRWLPTEAGL